MLYTDPHFRSKKNEVFITGGVWIREAQLVRSKLVWYIYEYYYVVLDLLVPGIYAGVTVQRVCQFRKYSIFQ
jgi:hypothetical protein